MFGLRRHLGVLPCVYSEDGSYSRVLFVGRVISREVLRMVSWLGGNAEGMMYR